MNYDIEPGDKVRITKITTFDRESSKWHYQAALLGSVGTVLGRTPKMSRAEVRVYINEKFPFELFIYNEITKLNELEFKIEESCQESPFDNLIRIMDD